MRSASSTASRTANSLAAMSVMKPRFTPRLSRWPVPSTISRPSLSSRAMIAPTFDEPMSSAAINGRSAAAVTTAFPSAGLRRRRRGEFKRVLEANRHLPRLAQVEPHIAVHEQAQFVDDPGQHDQRGLGGILPFGKRDRRARLGVEVPAEAAD